MEEGGSTRGSGLGRLGAVFCGGGEERLEGIMFVQEERDALKANDAKTKGVGYLIIWCFFFLLLLAFSL